MSFELVPLHIQRIMQSQNYTLFILQALHKQFAIYTAPNVGRNLKMHLGSEPKQRPTTYDLIRSILSGYEISLMQVVLTDVKDTVYFARLFLEQEVDGIQKILEIDARPSDCLSLALEHDVPLYCTREALEKTVALEE